MTERTIPDFLVEQVALGEASARTQGVVERVLGGAEVSRRVEAIGTSDREILERYPASDMAERIRLRAAAAQGTTATGLRLYRPSRPRSMFLTRLAAPVALAAVALFAVVLVPGIMERAGGSDTRAKGAPALQIYRDGGNDPVLLSDGARASQGDRLQIRYLPAGKPYGAIVSIDGRGSVTLHYPAVATDPTALDPQGEALPFSIVLDDAPSFERFFIITSEREFPATLALDAAASLARRDAVRGSLELPEDFGQSSVLLTKSPPAGGERGE